MGSPEFNSVITPDISHIPGIFPRPPPCQFCAFRDEKENTTTIKFVIKK